MWNEIPALLVFLPLLMAPLCVILSRNGRFAWLVAILTLGIVFGLSATSFRHILITGEELRYHMGGWLPPAGIEYRVDLLAVSMQLLISGAALLNLIFALPAAPKEIGRNRLPYFYTLYLLMVSGALGIVSTNDVFNLYVFVEIASLATYALIAFGEDKRAPLAALRYLILGTIGATFLLLAIGIVYLLTGTLNIDDMAQLLPQLPQKTALVAAFALFLLGMLLKMGAFPLHAWLPNAYALAPSALAPYMVSIASKLGLYIFLRIIISVTDINVIHTIPYVSDLLRFIAIASIVLGTASAIETRNIRRLFAFSSISHMGYMLLAVSLGTEQGLSAALTHLANHAVMSGTLFLALGGISYRVGHELTLENLRGLGRRMPLSGFACVIASFGLVGIPLTAGFMSKWYLMAALYGNQHYWLMAVVLLTSLFALVYVWRVVEALYFSTSSQPYGEAHPVLVLTGWVGVVLVIWLGCSAVIQQRISQPIAANAYLQHLVTEPDNQKTEPDKSDVE